MNNHHLTNHQDNSVMLLATAIANIKTNLSSHQLRVLIDSGSEQSFITEQIITELNITRHQSLLSVYGVSGHSHTQTRGKASIKLWSIHDNQSITITAHIMKNLTSILPSVEIDQHHWPQLKKLQLADPLFFRPRAIDMILGADIYGQIIKPNIIKFGSTSLIAQASIFGWLVLGPAQPRPSSSSNHCQLMHATLQPSNEVLHELLTKFWTMEEVPSTSSITEKINRSREDQECEDHFMSTHSRDATGRYIVRIPLKSSSKLLGYSHRTALSCLLQQLKRLKRDTEYKTLYYQFMKEYEDLGHMTKAQETPADQITYYLPHHGVLRPDSATTKLRVVFNGSSSTSSGLSLNDIMYTGENLLLNIVDVLIWIRQFKHIFSTDITKMYRQVMIHPDDRDLQRILWVDETGKIVPYQLTTVTYGTKAAPFQAVRALLQLVTDEGQNYPLAVPSLTRGRYVDDIFGGANSPIELSSIADQLTKLCMAGGFLLAKWHSTTTELSTINTSADQSTTLSLDDCATKILGLNWTPHADVFAFVVKGFSSTEKFTKRIISSQIAQIFDPLGFAAPVIINAKILLQSLWKVKLSWDDPLPSHIINQWLNIREQLTLLASITIPRWFHTLTSSTVELHGFSDASQEAMAAVIYITVQSSTGVKSSFVCAKTKVAHINKPTIPRLELGAALLLSELITTVQNILNLHITNVHLWTDSQIVLTWINAEPSSWKEYVKNRVHKIQQLTSNAQWRHVPGKINPADCASRGISTNDLINHQLWWTGPPWLHDQTSWPSQPEPSSTSLMPELRPGATFLGLTQVHDCHWDLIHKYSSLHKLIKITALCMKIHDKLKKRQVSSPLIMTSTEDLNKAKLFWIKSTQASHFSKEIRALNSNEKISSNHAFNRLTAYIDTDGVIRVGGRLDNADISFEQKHPAILPSKCRLAELIITASHLKTLHGGTQLTLSQVRQEYWILGGRAPVKAHVRRCVVCTRQRGIRAHQRMGQLPFSRVTPSPPFMCTGVDYAGPINIKSWRGRGNRTHKGWICVFVCFSTSASHFELVTDYSSDAFIAAYRRFISRRGIPASIHCDCGTTFKGAESELKKLFTSSTKEFLNISSELSKNHTQWLFNPPASPHMGGKWEAVVKSIKYHLRRTIGETLLTYEELSTLLNQIEAILNSRPLEPLSDDPDDVTALTPGHFLIGRPLSSIPEPSLHHLEESRLSRWQFIQQRVQQFWAHWSNHYLTKFNVISKWMHPTDYKVGTLVLITDERSPPCKWPLARITELHPSKTGDGLSRVASLKTATTSLIRPIAKLVILHAEQSPPAPPAPPAS